MNKTQLNKLSGIILDAAIEVHRNLGPGLLESVYEYCLVKELRERGLKAVQQFPLPVYYKDERLDVGFRADILVEDAIIIELKAVKEVAEINRAQVITYLKVTGKKIGLLVNFNVLRLIDGFERFVNGIDD
jgi:GxxExxY protein